MHYTIILPRPPVSEKREVEQLRLVVYVVYPARHAYLTFCPRAAHSLLESSSSSVLPKRRFATIGVSATVGGKRMGEAALCAT